MSQDNITMRVIKPEEGEKVIQFLLDNFYPEVPLMSCEPILLPTTEDKDNVRKAIASGCSIMAEDDGQLVGVSIALPKTKADIEKYFEVAEKLGNTKSGHISRLLGETNRDARIFERYEVQEFLYLFLSSVAPNQRGRNIGGRMIQELMSLGRQLNYKVLTLDCTSFYSAQMCERLGMECLNTVVYRDYVDESGNPIFKPKLPHVEMKTYGQSLV